MVAVIKTSSSLRNVLHYNEHKLKNNVAQLIYAEGFAKDTDSLNIIDKLRTFEKRNTLNERTKLNTVHISLNFHPDEKLSEEKLRAIANTYMQKIGFGEQPYLVYQHFDAGHPHLHLVSTNIRSDGKRISMQNIGKDQSTKARLLIEKEFSLKPATETELKLVYELKPVKLKIEYGKTETKRAITNVLNHVLPQYKYTSVAELNAVLKLYNVMADTGTKDSRIAKNGGLVYRILNDKGEKLGVPIKASIIYNKPTLKFLQEKFMLNETLRQKHKLHVKNAVDFILMKQSGRMGLNKLSEQLKNESIHLITRQNKEGRIYGITYIDHKSKCVFNGSDLGKPYAAIGLLQRLLSENSITKEQKIVLYQKENITGNEKNIVPKQKEKLSENQNAVPQSSSLESVKETAQNILDILSKEEYTGSLASELRDELKRRKRKRLRPE